MSTWLMDWKVSSIAQKIVYTGILTIGVSISGTMLGLWLGDYHQNQARKKLEIAEQQEDLLQKLEIHILEIRAHPQQLIAASEDPEQFRHETSELQANVQDVNALLTELEELSESYSASDEFLKRLYTDYRMTVGRYRQRFEDLWPQINPLDQPSDRRPETQEPIITAILDSRTQTVDSQFEPLTDNLERALAIATERQEAAYRDFEAAQRLREYLILASLVFSLGTAIALSVYTGRAIAHPLKAVTDTARQATREGNYDLQVFVATHDEVRVLADSLNQLIYKVRQQIEQLAQAQSVLEDRVQERTQELQTTLEALRETQAQLIQTEKMSSLGEMVAGVAHEINNPVNFIFGNVIYVEQYAADLLGLLTLYQDAYPEAEDRIRAEIEAIELDFLRDDLPKTLKSMRMGTKRIQEIVQSLRNFSRLDEAETKRVDLHEGIDSTLVILDNRIKQGIEVTKEYGDIPRISCYPAQLNQVFFNLFSNSIDALFATKTQPKQIAIRTTLMDGDRIRVNVQDNGPGIPPEIRHKIFNPFFTTKPVGEGTGLGLAVCWRIIQKHQGQIHVISEVGCGTEFQITLPVEATPIPVTDSAQSSVQLRGDP